MAKMTDQEIEQLKQQLKDKIAEVQALYNKLAEAGVMEIPDDLLDMIGGGAVPTSLPPQWSGTPGSQNSVADR